MIQEIRQISRHLKTKLENLLFPMESLMQRNKGIFFCQQVNYILTEKDLKQTTETLPLMHI